MTVPEQARPEQARPEQARPEQARPGQVRPGQPRPGQPRPGEARSREARFAEVTFDLAAVRGQLAASEDAERLAPVGLRAVIDGDGALGGLADAVAAYPAARDGVVVLADATPMTIGGDDLGAAVRDALSSRFRVGWVTVGDPARTGAPRPGPPRLSGRPAAATVHADEAAVAAATAALAGAGCVVTLGSGTVTDIGKAATPAGTPLVAVQTAASVNGYADPLSVLLRQGVKRTTRTRWADTLLIDPAVLAAAPSALNRAGIGDMMAMFTAPADWFLAGVLWPGARAAGGEPAYSAVVAGLTRPHGGRLLELGAGLTADHGRLAELARLLTLSGIAMGAAGVTAPASGMEHAVSHLLEMRDTARGEPGGFHGTQVGAATVVAAATWDLVRRRVDDGVLWRTPRLPDPDTAREAIASTFKALDPSGAMAAECFEGYAVKLRALAAGDPLAGLRDSFDRQAGVLDGLLASPGVIAAGLVAAGLPATLDGLGVDAATARWAIAASPLQRHRVSVADLALLTGGWGEAEAEEMLAVATAVAAEAAGAAGRT